MADEEKTISDELVVTKYKTAGDIVNRTLKFVLDLCVENASVKELCDRGDKMIIEETGKLYKKDKDMKKGIAFPTCLSINNCVCHFSPIRSEPDVILKEGDIVKIDLGAHIDGFIAVAAFTTVIGATAEKPATGRRADAVLAAYWSSQAALRLLKSGNANQKVTEGVQKVAEAFQCKPIEGMVSHQLKQFKIDGEKTIIQNPNDMQRKEHEKCDFDVHEVYAMDVLISTGEGVAKEQDTKVSIFKKTEEVYALKLKASRNLLSEVKAKYGSMPVNLRHFEEETKARMGVVECVSHKVIEAFHVLYEKPSELVTQFKHTVLLLPSGPIIVTGIDFPQENYKSESSVTDPDMKELLSHAIIKKKKNNKKKAAAAAGKEGEAAPTAAVEA